MCIRDSNGTVGDNFDAFNDSTVNISGGTVGDSFDANDGSTINISGGTVGVDFDAQSGSIVNITGGTVGNNFDAENGSTVNISGGRVGNGFDANNGSTVNITGGTVGRDFDTFNGSTVNISGGDFSLNGNVIDDLSSPLTLGIGDVFTGTLEDGSAFVFANLASGSLSSDNLNNVNLIETFTPTVDITPQTISTASILRSIRTGETLTVQTGGVLEDDFTAVNATFNVEGGSVGNFLSLIHISSPRDATLSRMPSSA